MATLATSRIEPRTRPEKGDSPAREIPRFEFRSRVDEILGRRPAIGLAVGVVRDGRLEFFDGRGVADVGSNTPITEDTVFRIGSITKLFTAIAVMQLVGAGPGRPRCSGERLPARLSADPAEAGFRPATLRHLLTHTAGIPDVRRTPTCSMPASSPSGGRPAAAQRGIREAAAVAGRVLPRRPADRRRARLGLRLQQPRLRDAGPDRRGRERRSARARLPRAHLRAARHGRHRSRPLGSDRLAAWRRATRSDAAARRPSRIATGSAPAPAASTRRPAT